MMNKFNMVIVAFVVTMVAAVSACANDTSEYSDDKKRLFIATVEGMSCTVEDSGIRVCDFRIGSDVHFQIAGVDLPDAALLIHKAKHFNEADYYIKIGGVHGCVIVRGPGMAHVYVNPRTADIYLEYQNCWPDQTMTEMQEWQFVDIQKGLNKHQ